MSGILKEEVMASTFALALSNPGHAPGIPDHQDARAKRDGNARTVTTTLADTHPAVNGP
jgi:hypothetical protein